MRGSSLSQLVHQDRRHSQTGIYCEWIKGSSSERPEVTVNTLSLVLCESTEVVSACIGKSMPRKKQDRPKHVTKWEESGGEGKELCEEETNTTTDNDSGAQPEPQQSASDTEDNSVEPNISSIDEPNNSNKNVNENDNKDAQKIKCDSGIRHDSLTSSDSALALRINAKNKTNNETYLISESRLSESDITSSHKSSSPEPPSVQMETDDVSAPLDFSIKPNKKASHKPSMNGPQSLSAKDGISDQNIVRSDAPLDLSLGKRLFALSASSSAPSKSPVLAKVPRFDSSSPWNYSAPRVLTPPKQSTTQSHNDMTNLWNGKLKNNTLSGKMSSPTSSPSSSTSPGRVSSGSHSGRQNPWQTQWINRSSEQTRDVFTCVWCKESFRSLAEMTDHMKKSPRCGMAGMQHATTSTHNTTAPPSGAQQTPSSHQPSTSAPKEPISSSVLAKNNVGLPRKLVRGQDVWLGRGAEQTRQILKCMWCGQSFKTLADMTTHMRVTQHYTNIISQEQIISWRTPEDKLTQAQVNAVLTCKVCDEAFGSLKELSYHMVKNAHYKEHILRSITEGGHGRRRQTRERRKKSLPVRKLLELERREMTKEEKEESETSPTSAGANGQFITCDECHEKIDTKSFISHIKLCKAQVKLAMRSFKSDKSPDRVRSPSSSGSRSGPPSRGPTLSPQVDIKTEVIESDCKTQSGSEVKDDLSETTNEANANVSESPASSFGSILNSIERLIEKSFDSKSRKTQSTGILQRLGIDEEVCPPWQHMPQVPWARNGTGSNEFFSDRNSSRSSGHHSNSPLPQDLLKESNGSISSPDSSQSCDDSNSCNSLTNNIGIPLKSSTTSPKLSFPISALISENSDEESDHKLKDSSPKSEIHSQFGTYNPPTPEPTNCNNKFVDNETKTDKLSDISDEEKPSKSPNRGQLSSSPLALEVKTEHKRQRDQNSPLERDNKTSSPSSTTNSKNINNNNNNTTTSTRNKSEVNEKNVESDAFHPLMQLQKLLDKTDSGNKNKSINSSNTISNNSSGVGVPTSLLAFSWACNDATTSVSSSSSAGISDEKHHKSEQHLMKCAFCETHFISKGAYRHHLSKMHFIKSDKHCDLTTTNTNNNSTTNSNNNNHNNNDNGVKECLGSGGSGGTGTSANSETNITANESPHSKFLKYTELAKQLSSKYV